MPSSPPLSPRYSQDPTVIFHAKLSRAVQTAQAAVAMDQDGADPHTTVATYARCIGLLNELLKAANLQDGEYQRILDTRDGYIQRLRVLVAVHKLHYPSRVSSSGMVSPGPGSPIRFVI